MEYLDHQFDHITKIEGWGSTVLMTSRSHYICFWCIASIESPGMVEILKPIHLFGYSCRWSLKLFEVIFIWTSPWFLSSWTEVCYPNTHKSVPVYWVYPGQWNYTFLVAVKHSAMRAWTNYIHLDVIYLYHYEISNWPSEIRYDLSTVGVPSLDNCSLSWFWTSTPMDVIMILYKEISLWSFIYYIMIILTLYFLIFYYVDAHKIEHILYWHETMQDWVELLVTATLKPCQGTEIECR